MHHMKKEVLVTFSLFCLFSMSGCGLLNGNIKIKETDSEAISRVMDFGVSLSDGVCVESRYYIDDYGWFMGKDLSIMFSL